MRKSAVRKRRLLVSAVLACGLSAGGASAQTTAHHGPLLAVHYDISRLAPGLEAGVDVPTASQFRARHVLGVVGALPVPITSLSALPATAEAAGPPNPAPRPLRRPVPVVVQAALMPADATRAAGDQIRCNKDNSLCIRAASYTEDVCTAIDHSAGKAGIDPHFFARLLWQESLFDPAAISPVGAQGIAQFMPSTAAMVGLDDPYNPAKAIEASAQYLRKLRDGFGNIGLAAIAYNGGENRAANFIGGASGLPFETRNYVAVITGHDALSWRDTPPEKVDLRLAGDIPFREACITLAAGRGIKAFVPPSRIRNWGVIVASHPRQDVAQRYAAQLQSRLRPILRGEPVVVQRKRMSGAPRPVYTAQVGYDTRQGAMAFCNRLKQSGGRCIVLRN